MPRRSWPALLLLVVLAPVVRAQSPNASLNGRITDSVDAVIVKANVAAINLGTHVRYETATKAEGEYYLANVPPGLYRIEIEKSRFKKLIKSGVSLHFHDATEIDFELTLDLMSDEPGRSTESQQEAQVTPAAQHTRATRFRTTLRLVCFSSLCRANTCSATGAACDRNLKGITPRLILVADLAGNSRGGRSQGATAPNSVELSLFFDLDKIFGLKGGPMKTTKGFTTASPPSNPETLSS